MSYTIQLPTEYGTILVNRHDINQTQNLLQTNRAIDHDEIVQFLNFVEPGSDAVDIGACFGTWTLALSKVAARVITFEAQRLLFQQICGSLALNGIENVFVLNRAVGASAGYVSLPKYDYNKRLQFGCVYFCARGKHGDMEQPQQRSTEAVKRVALDSYGLANVSAIKIDVEGMELDVLEGAKRTIRNNLPALYVESLLVGQPAVEEFFRTQGLDYSFFNTGMDTLCIPNEKWAVSQTPEGLQVQRREK